MKQNTKLIIFLFKSFWYKVVIRFPLHYAAYLFITTMIYDAEITIHSMNINLHQHPMFKDLQLDIISPEFVYLW